MAEARYLCAWPSGGGGPRYYVDGDAVYDHSTGKPTFYIQDKTVYAYADGKPTFWIDGKHLYEYGGSGQPVLYFA
jgi:hypothetical protein